MNNQEAPEGYKKTKVGIIPLEWEVVKLKNITTVETGKTPLRTNSLFWVNGSVNWITTTEVNKTYITTSSEKITKLALDKLKMKLMPIDTILLAMYGQGKTRGKVALLKIESTINQAFASIKPNKKYSTNFLFNYLNKSYMQIRNLSHGSNQDNLNLDTVKYLDIPLPPLKEQQKIAKILTTWDDAISKQEELIKTKEHLKKGLMQKLLSGEVRFDGLSGEWEEKRGNEIFKPISNKNHKSDLPILAISQEFGAIPREMIDYKISVTTNSISSYKVVDIGDFIISLRSFQGGIEYSNYKGICSPAYIILRPFIKINDVFYQHYFKTNKYIQELNSKLEGIRDGKMVSFRYFSEIKLPYPPLQEQQKIAGVLSAADKEIELLKNELEHLKEQKKGLMQRLLTGEMRTSNIKEKD